MGHIISLNQSLNRQVKSMKSFIASAILAGIAQAGFSDMKTDFSNMVNRYVRGLMESGTPVDRAISDILTGDNFDRINEYACWYYFEDDHGRGHGKPLNGIDHICKIGRWIRLLHG